ncbi:PREDICTED: uncharacterized protein LOC104595873 [Nelumbo nucifera]|uniref:DUF599 domain-containing protein n=2 Tax=Nelumbo nucifera TaxID=4432 RepID=A0A822ZA01_NELNU|nr:PREDICTED: uncharacterized protein LOC104595873 [Nelumbo nucifera]DAD40531.1 TPA_asm: hypothetical protein HUJ06_014854 [Nelumbo nucifera]
MKKQLLDYSLVSSGFLMMVVYHIWLLHRIIKHPTKTVLGVNAINRLLWVRTMMDNMSKNGILAVQTLRNNIMASTLLASMAIMLSSVIAVLMSNRNARPSKFVYGDESDLGFSIKLFSILICFLMAFLFNVQSIRYYSHASILINVPVKNMSSSSSSHLTVEYVGRTVNRGSHFWSLGLRAFYFSFPLFFWIFGPIPMFLCCLVLVFMLYFLDVTFEFGQAIGAVDEDKDEEQEVN